MKRVILFCASMIMTGFMSFGQIAPTIDTLKSSCIPYGASTPMHNPIKNNGTKKVAVTWTVANTSLPTGWSIENICDNYNCYTPPTTGAWPPYTGDSIASGASMDLKVTYILTASAANGTGIVQIANTDGTNTTNAVFKGWTCAPLEIVMLDGKNNFTADYNTSTSNLTVVVNTDIEKYTVEIYNILGSKVKSVTSNNSITTINMEDMVSGQYIVRLLNDQKSTIGVKKISILN